MLMISIIVKVNPKEQPTVASNISLNGNSKKAGKKLSEKSNQKKIK